jgi:hypothetical protein
MIRVLLISAAEVRRKSVLGGCAMDDHRFRAAITLATALMVLPALASAYAQNDASTQAPAVSPTAPPPAATQPQAQAQGAAGAPKSPLDCEAPAPPAKVGGASFGLNPTASLQTKSWQAPNGMIEFTIDSFASIPAGSLIGICTRWAQQPPAKYTKAARPICSELSTDGRQLKITMLVPDPDKSTPPSPKGKREYAAWLVPQAEVRVIIASDDTAKPSYLADITTRIGITNVFWASLLAIAIVVIAFVILTLIAYRKLLGGTTLKANPLLLIVSQSGYASLSQFQIVLWTFLVGASAIYVMALSGELIEITNGTLILLGISGAAAIGAKVHGANESANVRAAAASAAAEKAAADKILAEKTAAALNAPADAAAAQRAAADKLAAEQNAAAKAAAHDAAVAKAVTIQGTGAPRKPRWADLVISDDDGLQIDVTRVQMLYFTLIGAAFVLMQVATTYVIPEIPTGFLVLMGISNGVYVGSKFVGPS